MAVESFPVSPEALLSNGAATLTSLLIRFTTMSPSDAVTAIMESEEIHGGSTGRKLKLTVTYKNPNNGLAQCIFVKFSRDLQNPYRDAGKFQMEREVALSKLSTMPAFPITVPRCYFADFNKNTGSGIMITECIPFAKGEVEAQHKKALDYQITDALTHYEALIKNIGLLAGSYRPGSLGLPFQQQFAFQPELLDVSRSPTDSIDGTNKSIGQLIEFLQHHPNLVPENLQSPRFLERLRNEAPLIVKNISHINHVLDQNQDYVALCHWNAHIDNAWFWRSNKQLECGLFDWGNVGFMNVAMAFWGCLSAAEPDIWTKHQTHLIQLFINTYYEHSNVQLCINDFRFYLSAYVLKMGITWLLDAPVKTLSKLPLNRASTRRSHEIESNEKARSQLLIMINFLNYWDQTNIPSWVERMSAYSS